MKLSKKEYARKRIYNNGWLEKLNNFVTCALLGKPHNTKQVHVSCVEIFNLHFITIKDCWILYKRNLFCQPEISSNWLWYHWSTLQSLYYATRYNTILAITRPGLGSQMVIFPIVSWQNCPFITWSTYNTVQFFGSQTQHYEGTALYLNQNFLFKEYSA